MGNEFNDFMLNTISPVIVLEKLIQPPAVAIGRVWSVQDLRNSQILSKLLALVDPVPRHGVVFG